MAQPLVSIALHGATLHATLINGAPHVSIRSLCEALGLDWKAQWSRIQRHEVLSSTVVVTTTVAADGKLRDAVCIPLSKLNGWLFGISASRVKPELRARLVQYQRECFDVLAAHFGAGPVAADQPVRLNAARYTADVSPDGSMSLRPWLPGTVAGTPEALASAVASGGWGTDATARMLVACAQAMQTHAVTMSRRANNLQAALDELRAQNKRTERARQARQLRLASRAAVQATAQHAGAVVKPGLTTDDA